MHIRAIFHGEAFSLFCSRKQFLEQLESVVYVENVKRCPQIRSHNHHVSEAKFIGLLPFNFKDTCPKKLEEKQQNKAHLGTVHDGSRLPIPYEKGTLGELRDFIASATTSRCLINASICSDYLISKLSQHKEDILTKSLLTRFFFFCSVSH